MKQPDASQRHSPLDRTDRTPPSLERDSSRLKPGETVTLGKLDPGVLNAEISTKEGVKRFSEVFRDGGSFVVGWIDKLMNTIHIVSINGVALERPALLHVTILNRTPYSVSPNTGDKRTAALIEKAQRWAHVDMLSRAEEGVIALGKERQEFEDLLKGGKAA